MYGTVKIHKNGNPLCPIISQIPTPIYDIAKHLNSIITPYIPAKYIINSTDDFLQIRRVLQPHGIIASLDVESLFTNVPVLDTIEIICDAIYNKNSNPLLPPQILAETFSARRSQTESTYSTTEHDGVGMHDENYLQHDGVGMGSPLGVTFANYYMCHIENTVLDAEPSYKPTTYCRYIDDIFIITHNLDNLIKLKEAFEAISIVNYTYEIGTGNQLNFLVVHVDATQPNIQCSV